MAYIECNGGGKNIVNVMYQGEKIPNGNNIVINENAYIGDIFVILNFAYTVSEGYAVAVSGCEVVSTYTIGPTTSQQVTVLRATSENLSFKIPTSYNGAEYTRFTKMGKAINVSVTQFVNSSSVTDKTVNISANKNDVICIPWGRVQTGAYVTPTDAKIINDNIAWNEAYHLYGYRVTGTTGSSFYFYRIYSCSYIKLT